MPYLFATDEQRRQMLDVIGVSSLEELLSQVPQELQLGRPLDLPPAMAEFELEHELQSIAKQNNSRTCFMGGGAYDHFIPAVVDEIAGRGEFYTAYTPYQPEASQGSLQAFFEYQTLICQLTGMDVSNASLYEGGTAVSEAVFMAMRVNGREKKVVLSAGVNPEYRQTVETYLCQLGCEVVTVPVANGTTDLGQLEAAIDDQTACVVVQSPNFFGCIEDVSTVSGMAKAAGALSVMSFDPISLGVLKRPGDHGVDIAVAEGQGLGTPLQYGGPYLGILACRQQYVRKMPGRLIAQTKDRDGKTCYVLGLQTREQHIRRDKATSNICTNQGLLALRATIYLSVLGPAGLKEVATHSCQRAHDLATKLCQIPGVSLMYSAPFFKEFVLKVDDVNAFVAKAQAAGFDVGPDLHADSGILVAVTEKRTQAEIDAFVAAVS
ncbi:MAG: aminomethyl-transferring glycine dehydrogenase subunit GcvPA [Planctomycetaceae bacterium]|nr:aminomethyl-transferring glycine dehydrogenase subunit GcvPA [Planctomycetaceae bacterium]MCA9045289.1 aminomethyl-transferring glycine dehydrogenase subunit GcvPA [Planctomycetaceae bacterium]